MTIDYSKLKGRIKEKYGSQQDFAKAIGLSEKNISDKLNNKSYWKQSDIDAATELLGIKKEDGYSWSDRTNMLKKKEIVKLTWECYIPTAAVGLSTIACIIGAHNIHLRRNAALASLYSLTESAFKEYQSKVVETIGKNKELKVRDDVVSDTMTLRRSEKSKTKSIRILYPRIL